MSVPPRSRVTVSRVRLPGLRFGVDLAGALDRKGDEVRDRLAKGGWRAVLRLVGPSMLELEPDWFVGRVRPEEMERHLVDDLRKAGVPDRVGVFLEPEESVPDGPPALPPGAALAVLARRSGPLYLPQRRLEPSLADPRRALVLFFPEEP